MRPWESLRPRPGRRAGGADRGRVAGELWGHRDRRARIVLLIDRSRKPAWTGRAIPSHWRTSFDYSAVGQSFGGVRMVLHADLGQPGAMVRLRRTGQGQERAAVSTG